MSACPAANFHRSAAEDHERALFPNWRLSSRFLGGCDYPSQIPSFRLNDKLNQSQDRLPAEFFWLLPGAA